MLIDTKYLSLRTRGELREDFTTTDKALQLHVLNVKVLVGSFHQEKALVGSLSVIVKSSDDLRLKL